MDHAAKEVAGYIVGSRMENIPQSVQHEGARAFLNWLGCVLGGCNDDLVSVALDSLEDTFGPPKATVIGRSRLVDIPNAALLNSLSSSIHAFDDAHPSTVIHPTRSVASALVAVAEGRPVTGSDLVHALVLGIDVECRVGKALMVNPARVALGFLPTGLAGAIGAAAGIAKLRRLNETQTLSALGLAAGTAAGFREAIGSSAALFFLASAARNGAIAAQLAETGMSANETSVDGPKGFLATYAENPNVSALIEALGERYEVSCNTYKPYPCGVWVHPTIDVCLEIAAGGIAFSAIDAVRLAVHPQALAIAGARDPTNSIEAQASLCHWAAAALVSGQATLAEATDAFVNAPAVAALRGRVEIVADESCRLDEAKGEFRLKDGHFLTAHVDHCRGSEAKPMTDDELSKKFLGQAGLTLSPHQSERLLAQCWDIEAIPDVGMLMGRFFR